MAPDQHRQREDDATDTTQPAPAHDEELRASPTNPQSDDAGSTAPPVVDPEEFMQPAPKTNGGRTAPPDSFGVAGDGGAEETGSR